MSKVLHICSYYYTSDLYLNLFTNLYNKGVKQLVYAPLKKKNDVDSVKTEGYELFSPKLFYPYHRLLFNKKIKKAIKSIVNTVDISSFNILHAHTLFSDGAVAYELFNKYSIPYIITVRNTDVNVFYKYFIHLRKYAKLILESSSSIVFVSEAYKKSFLLLLDTDLVNRIKDKITVIPNGIDDYWHKNSEYRADKDLTKVNLIFVGKFNKNKNIEYIIKVFLSLRSIGLANELFLVGYNNKNEFANKLKNKYNSDNIHFIPYTSDFDILKSYYNNSDIFIMPSFKETFGLVYVEALSQGLPVLYTKGQGFDGAYEEGVVGYSVDPNNIEDAISKVKLIVKHYKSMSDMALRNSIAFNWDDISDKYITLYKEIKNKN